MFFPSERPHIFQDRVDRCSCPKTLRGKRVGLSTIGTYVKTGDQW